MKEFICKNHGEFIASEPKCNKCVVVCPRCHGEMEEVVGDHTIYCVICKGVGGASPNTAEETEMWERYSELAIEDESARYQSASSMMRLYEEQGENYTVHFRLRDGGHTCEMGPPQHIHKRP